MNVVWKKKFSLLNRINPVENIVLIIYTLYCIGMTAVSIFLGWPYYVEAIIICGMLSYWWIHWTQYKNYHFRAFYLSLMALINFTIYALLAENLEDILPALCALSILLGVYNIVEILYLVVICTVFFMLYHGFISQSMSFETELECSRTILQILSTYVVEFITYVIIRTNRKSSEKNQEMIRNLQAAEQSKTDFLINMSHEIRTPINTINGMSEILLRNDISKQMQEEILQIQTSGRNLLAKVNDIIDFTELCTDKVSLAEESYNLASTINDVINIAIAQMDRQHQELIIDCDPQIPRNLWGDEQMIRRILIIFIHNAIQFTKEGGIYLLISYRKEEYGINLSIKVQDTGIGITEENLEKLFSNFNQVDTKRNRQEGGMGLGLAIAKKMTEMMGGFINVKSTYEEGSEFQLVVPQKVIHDAPFVTVEHPDEIQMLAYLSVDCYSQMKIRDAYYHTITHMTKQLHINCRITHSLQETKRRMEQGAYTHLLLTAFEYKEDISYFETLSRKMMVIVVNDRNDTMDFSSYIKVIYKPFYVLSFAALLNGESHIQWQDGSYHQRNTFTAPEANILVVDDNLMNLKVVEGLLRPYQIKIFTASGGEEALEKLQTERYDLLFMDHMMPKMDGVETTHLIRQKTGTYFQELPIIALTANAIGGAREMFLAEGFQDFVAKPIEMSVMERVLKRYLPSCKVLEQKTQNNTEKISPNPELLFEHINCQDGLKYCAWSIEDYKEILSIYYKSGQEKLPEIQNYFESCRWKDYTILVHALKSTSKGIGANFLSDLAKRQESAGKAKNEKRLILHHAEMIKEYELVLNELAEKDYMKQHREITPSEEVSTESLSEISKDNWIQELEELKRALESCEMDAVTDHKEKLSACSYQGKTVNQMLRPLDEFIRNFDFYGAVEALEKIQKEQE